MTDFNSFHPDPKPTPKPKVPKGFKKPSGELALFHRIYEKRGGICGITKQPLVFNVNCFMHVLSKKAFPSFRLEEANILLVQREIHFLYDCSGKSELLAKFPKAEIIYELKEMLKEAYARNVKR